MSTSWPRLSLSPSSSLLLVLSSSCSFACPRFFSLVHHPRHAGNMFRGRCASTRVSRDMVTRWRTLRTLAHSLRLFLFRPARSSLGITRQFWNSLYMSSFRMIIHSSDGYLWKYVRAEKSLDPLSARISFIKHFSRKKKVEMYLHWNHLVIT